jgi:Rrf2 family protein
MLELAKNYKKGPISMSSISKKQNIPVKYLEQLIIPLKKGKLVTSVRGPKGGHMLSKSPEKISVWEVLTLLETKLFMVDCLGDENVCENSRDCLIRPIWREAFQSMVDIFKDNNLKNIHTISEKLP